VPFTPRLIPAILPNLAHHVAMIQSAAIRTNKLLLNVIQNLPSPTEGPLRSVPEKQTPSRTPASPTPTTSASTSRQSTFGKDSSRDVSSPEPVSDSQTPQPALKRSRGSGLDMTMTPRALPSTDMPPPPLPSSGPSRPNSPTSLTSQTGHIIGIPYTQPPEEADLFDYQATVNELTIQFLSEFEETRVAALKWLIMLHQKAPKKVRDRLLRRHSMELISLPDSRDG